MIQTILSALVPVSGRDRISATASQMRCALFACETVGFDYGQRHRRRLACRHPVPVAAIRDRVFPPWGERARPRPTLLDASVLKSLGDSAI